MSLRGETRRLGLSVSHASVQPGALWTSFAGLGQSGPDWTLAPERGDGHSSFPGNHPVCARRELENGILLGRLILNRLTHDKGALGSIGKREWAAWSLDGIPPWWRLRDMQTLAVAESRLRPAEDRDSIDWVVAAGGQVRVAFILNGRGLSTSGTLTAAAAAAVVDSTVQGAYGDSQYGC